MSSPARTPKSPSRVAVPVGLPRKARRHPQAEPVHEPWNDPRLDEGIRLFNEGKHWHAHEEWEQLWLGLEGDDKLFVQGLIMAAAMLHQYRRGVMRGVENHYANVLARLPPHAPGKWGIDVEGLLAQLRPFGEAGVGDGGTPRDPATVRIRRTPA